VDVVQQVHGGVSEQFLEAAPDGIVVTGPGGRIVFVNRQAESLSGYSRQELLGMPVERLVPEGLRSRHVRHRRAYMAQPSVRPMGSQLDIRFVRKDGSEFPADIALSVVTTDRRRLVVASVRNITDRRRLDGSLRAVLEVAKAALAGTDEDTQLRLIARRSRELVDADLAAVAITEPDGESSVVRMADGRRAAAVLGLRISSGACLTGGVAAGGGPAAGSAELAKPLLDAAHAGPVLMVPLASSQGQLGMLTLANEPGGAPFSDADLRIVELFGAQAAVAIDYWRARDELRRFAVLEDRERIGRDLHDGVIQELFAVGMELQGMATMTGDSSLRRRVEGSVARLDEVIHDLRNYIFGLGPGLAADRHLTQLLEELTRPLKEQHGVACSVHVDRALAPRLSGHMADLAQFVREALANVARHAEATVCRISLQRERHRIVLEIEDDGRGFSPSEAYGMGLGLRNLDQRARALGGMLEIASAPGKGTAVVLTIPS
jgi:PAS domain S-box-containing protein